MAKTEGTYIRVAYKNIFGYISTNSWPSFMIQRPTIREKCAWVSPNTWRDERPVFFCFLTNVKTSNWKNSEFVQPQPVVQSFAVEFSSISVFFPVQWTGPANTSHHGCVVVIAFTLWWSIVLLSIMGGDSGPQLLSIEVLLLVLIFISSLMSSGRRDTMQEGLTNGTMWKEEWWEERRWKIIQFPFLEFNMITWHWSFNRLVNNSEPLGSTHLAQWARLWR